MIYIGGPDNIILGLILDVLLYLASLYLDNGVNFKVMANWTLTFLVVSQQLAISLGCGSLQICICLLFIVNAFVFGFWVCVN